MIWKNQVLYPNYAIDKFERKRDVLRCSYNVETWHAWRLYGVTSPPTPLHKRGERTAINLSLYDYVCISFDIYKLQPLFSKSAPCIVLKFVYIYWLIFLLFFTIILSLHLSYRSGGRLCWGATCQGIGMVSEKYTVTFGVAESRLSFFTVTKSYQCLKKPFLNCLHYPLVFVIRFPAPFQSTRLFVSFLRGLHIDAAVRTTTVVDLNNPLNFFDRLLGWCQFNLI